MPIYTNKCPKCEYRFEKKKSVDTRSVDNCPECGSLASLIISPIGGHIWKNPEPLYHKDGSYQDKY